MSRHNILQAASLDVVQGSPSSLMLYTASSPSNPSHHQAVIGYMQIRSHQTTLVFHFQKTMNALLIIWRELRMPYPPRCIGRRCLWLGCVSEVPLLLLRVVGVLLKPEREDWRRWVKCRVDRQLRRSLRALSRVWIADCFVRTDLSVFGGLHLPMHFVFDDQEETDMLHSACSETLLPCLHVPLHILQICWMELVKSILVRRSRKLQMGARMVKRQLAKHGYSRRRDDGRCRRYSKRSTRH